MVRIDEWWLTPITFNGLTRRGASHTRAAAWRRRLCLAAASYRQACCRAGSTGGNGRVVLHTTTHARSVRSLASRQVEEKQRVHCQCLVRTGGSEWLKKVTSMQVMVGVQVLLLVASAVAAATLRRPAAFAHPSIVASPPSTLLQPGTTSLEVSLSTTTPTACRWGPKDELYAALPHDFNRTGTANHLATVTGLSGSLNVSVVYVRCEAYPDPLVLAYRSVPDVGSAPFPRMGNLWGSHNFRDHPSGLKYAADRASLWLGSDWSAKEIAELRAYNPFTIVLTSINACETNDQSLPDDFYLTNITRPNSTKGRLQSWPSAFRLDLTNPKVQKYQAQLMYGLVAYGGTGYGPHPGALNATVAPLTYDGIFVDNVFMDDGAGVNSQDIFHNRFVPVDRETGKAMTNFGER